jgi:hypothetical protein
MKAEEGASNMVQKQFSSAPVNTVSATGRKPYKKFEILTVPFQGEPVIASCLKRG